MTIAIRGIQPRTTFHARVLARMEGALTGLHVSPVAAQVTFTDDNGPKGGLGTRCAVSVRVPYRPLLRVDHVASTSALAFQGAFAGLERQLERYRQRQRDIRRRPKKYFVAKRLLTGGLERTRASSRARRRKAN